MKNSSGNYPKELIYFKKTNILNIIFMVIKNNFELDSKADARHLYFGKY